MFNLEDRYEDCNNVSMRALCKEILMETTTEELRQSGVVSVESIDEKIFKGGSSLNSKLKEFGIDLFFMAELIGRCSEEPEERERRERFSALQVLKLFYFVEKDRSNGNQPINLTRILKYPNCNNWEKNNEKTRAYQEAYERVYQGICSQVEHGEEYEPAIQQIHESWVQLIYAVFRVMYRVHLEETEFRNLCVAMEDLAERLKELVDGGSFISAERFPNSVMEAVILFLLQNKVMGENTHAGLKAECDGNQGEEEEKIRLDLGMAGSEVLLEWGESFLTWRQFEKMQHIANFRRDDVTASEIEFILRMFSPFTGGSSEQRAEMLKDAGFFPKAFSYIRSLLEQSAKRHGIDYTEGIPLYVLDASIQTISSIYRCREFYWDGFFGDTHPIKPWKSTLEKQGPFPTAAIQDWEDRLMKQILSTIGREEAIRPMCMMQEVLMKIEEQIISFGPLDGIQKRSDEWRFRLEQMIEESLQVSLSDDEFSLFPF